MKRTIGITAAALAITCAAPASAAIVFTEGNLADTLSMVTLPGADADDGSDPFVTGLLVAEGVDVNFEGDVNIDSAWRPNPKIEASDRDLLTSLTISLQSGFGATKFLVDVVAPRHTQSTMQLMATDQFGHTFTSSAFDFNGGQNWFNIVTGGNQLLTSITFMNMAIRDVRNVQFGGVQPLISRQSLVPEPESWALMIMGFAGAGALLRQQRRRVHLATA